MGQVDLFSLGKIYPSDFLKPGEQPRCEPIELKLVMDNEGFVRLSEVAPKDVLWGERYWYSSSVSETMKEQLKDVVYSIIDLVDLKKGDLWIDIAGNSGYMLSQVSKSVIRVSVDPVGGDIKKEAEKNCDLVIQDYFSAKEFDECKYGHLKAKVITGISFFYDLENPGEFLDNVYEVLDDDGLLVLQMSYTPLMLQQLELSNICHEHIYYYSLFNIKLLLDKHGFKILDVTLNNTNAGSFRLFIMKEVGDAAKFGSQTHRDVSHVRIESLLEYEDSIALDSLITWRTFHSRIKLLKENTMNFISSEKQKGKMIMGYGASTKLNTVLQVFGITTDLITAIADKSPAKWGLRTVGTNIPIISEEEMRQRKPDYLFVGPNHFLQEFIERESEFLSNGGKFISIMPEFKIISK